MAAKGYWCSYTTLVRDTQKIKARAIRTWRCTVCDRTWIIKDTADKKTVITELVKEPL